MDDTSAIAVLKWLAEQPSPVTTTNIHRRFAKSLSFPVVESILKSLQDLGRIERVQAGFREKWRAVSRGSVDASQK